MNVLKLQTIALQYNVRIENNWVMDSPKYGIRFDGERPKIGEHGYVIGNVVAKTNGMNLKGDYHTAMNNFVVESNRTNSKEVRLRMLSKLFHPYSKFRVSFALNLNRENCILLRYKSEAK